MKARHGYSTQGHDDLVQLRYKSTYKSLRYGTAGNNLGLHDLLCISLPPTDVTPVIIIVAMWLR